MYNIWYNKIVEQINIHYFNILNARVKYKNWVLCV
jgi:hypothetical protein